MALAVGIVRCRLLLLLVAGSLGAPSLAADLEPCDSLHDQRDALMTQAMKAEVELSRRMRDRVCPALNRQLEQADVSRGPSEPVDYLAALDCRKAAEALLERKYPILYRNPLRFTFYTPQGAKLARQADWIAWQARRQGCPTGR
jgi:hypothetical protein